MKRSEQIESHLSTLEAPATNERLAGWEANLVVMYRRDFTRTGDLNDNQFETLEKIRHRVAPPPLPGRNGKDVSCWDALIQAVKACPEVGAGVIHLDGHRVAISWGTMVKVAEVANPSKVVDSITRFKEEVRSAVLREAAANEKRARKAAQSKDLRVCTNTGGNRGITAGKTYEVLRTDSGFVTICDDEGRESVYLVSRFAPKA